MTKTKRLQPGQKFSKLTVIKLDHTEERVYNCSVKGSRCLTLEYYLCKCECGNYTVVDKYHLTKKVDNTESCGCLNGTHHKTHTRLYEIWAGMRKRCFNKNCVDYKNYGGRGITLYEEWKNGFEAFYEWAINNGYQENLTIERIDYNGNYEPNNCTWITKAEQSKNRRGVKKYSYNGQLLTLSEIADRLGIKYSTLYMRMRRAKK